MLSDLRFALRSLAKTPGFTAVAIVTLALGIGATVAIFSLVDTALLKPLPYREPERLARIYTQSSERNVSRFRASTAEFFELRRETRSWQSLDAWRTGGANFSARETPLRVTATSVSGGLLAQTLGVAPALGRAIAPADDEPGAPLVAVISYRLWQRAFGGDGAALGREITLNGRSHTVIGVMPEAFAFPVGEADSSDLWVPLQIDPALPVFDHSVFLIGRLRPGVALGEAQAELDAIVASQAGSSAPDHFDPRAHSLATHALRDEVVRNARPALTTLLGAVGFLLLIACVNVANLLLSRAEARQREIAIRGALGAGLTRLARQFAVEGLLLSALGALAGLVLAFAALGLIGARGVAGLPQAAGAGVDARVLGFALLVTTATGLVFGFAPLAHVLRRNLHGAIRMGSAATTRAAGAQRFRQALIACQLGLALVLLTGTGLMLRTFWNLQQVDAGFDAQRIMTMTVSLRDDRYGGEAARNFWATLDERLASLPGVDAAALTSALPPVAEDFGWGTLIEGYVPVEGGSIASVQNGSERIPSVDHYQVVTPSYFDTLRIDLVAGRAFDGRDGAQGAKAVIINETFAHAIWGNESAIGHRLNPVLWGWYTIVGVVADVKNAGVDQPTGTALYLPYAQVPAETGLLRAPYMTVRSHGSADAVVADVRAAVGALDATLPLASVRTLEQVVSASQSRPRFLALLLSVFAGVSLALAAVGLYGVIAYSVAQRTKELGIRIALGARPRAVLARVLRGGLALTAVGLALGVGGALALARFLSGFLFGVDATDPTTYASVAVLLASVATVATYVAARRATKVDPCVALRAE